MDITVQKFGGSSLATDEQVDAVADRIAAAHRAGGALVVVVSARGDTTDRLLATTDAITAGAVTTGAGAASDVAPVRRETDQLLATGETASAAQLALALRARAVAAVSLTGPQAGLRAEGEPGAGLVTTVEISAVHAHLDRGEVVVVAGFQAQTASGDVITLGRGGSDISAVALAAALRARTCEIYSDVDGVHGADPRIVDDAPVLPVLASAVMAEMAFAGARVLHARAVELAAAAGVDLVVRHAHRDGPGSTIVGRDAMDLENAIGVVAVTHEEDLAQVVVRGDPQGGLTAADVLSALAGQRVGVDSLACSPPGDALRVALGVTGAEVPAVLAALQPVVAGAGGEVDARMDLGRVSLVGNGLLSRPTLAAEALAELRELAIPAECISATQVRVCFAVPRERVRDAVFVLYRRLPAGPAPGAADLVNA